MEDLHRGTPVESVISWRTLTRVGVLVMTEAGPYSPDNSRRRRSSSSL